MVNETAAQKARREAEEAREKKDRADAEQREKANRDAAEKARREAEKGDGDGAGGGENEATRAGQGAVTDQAAQSSEALLARLDAQDRLIATLTAQSKGSTGVGVEEAKNTTAAGPGAAFDPRITGRMGAGVTSGPSLQPHPSSGVEISRAVGLRDPNDWEDGEVTVWGRDPVTGRPIRPREYPQVKEQDVLVTKTGYHEDAVRNVGETIRGYTGPLASWFEPIDADGKVIPRQRFLKDLRDAA